MTSVSLDHNLARPTISAIVCAYNEEQTLSSVLDALIATPWVDEIVVFDDGSHDSTPDLVRRYAARSGKINGVCLDRNQGKAYAMTEAAVRARGEMLLFVDADLHNWQDAFAWQIVQPLLADEADLVIGYPVRAEGDPDRFTPWLHWISGQRALWRNDLLPLLDTLRESRYGVETLINLYYRRHHKRIALIPLHGLIHPAKLEKERPLKAIRSYASEGYQIAQAVTQYSPLTLAAYGLKPPLVDDTLTRLDVRQISKA